MAWALSDEPDWHAAAQALVDGCNALESDELRVRLMEQLCGSLGNQLYPAFLNILYIIGTSGDERSQSVVAGTLVHALTTGRLPSGKRAAWGAEIEKIDHAFGQTRTLGPLEYLCAWYAQPSGNKPLSAAAFYKIAHALVTLISTDERSKALYCAKLKADVEDPLEGTFARPTRRAIGEMIQAWEGGGSPDEVVSRFQNTLHGGGLSRLATHTSPFP